MNLNPSKDLEAQYNSATKRANEVFSELQDLDAELKKKKIEYLQSCKVAADAYNQYMRARIAAIVERCKFRATSKFILLLLIVIQSCFK